MSNNGIGALHESVDNLVQDTISTNGHHGVVKSNVEIPGNLLCVVTMSSICQHVKYLKGGDGD